MKFREPYYILGVRIDPLTMEESLVRIGSFFGSDQQHHIVTVNPEFIMEAQKNERFRSVLNKASLAVPDGVGLRFAALILKKWVPQRITGADLTIRIARLAAEQGIPIMLFGAEHGIAKRAALALQKMYPNLRIVGAENEENFLRYRRSDREVVARIRRRRPGVLFVALGAPKQDLWISEYLLQTPSVKIAMGVGGTFDYLAGVVPRAPLVVQRLGLEWLWRLAKEKPALRGKRFRRILTATVRFPFVFIRSRV